MPASQEIRVAIAVCEAALYEGLGSLTREDRSVKLVASVGGEDEILRLVSERALDMLVLDADLADVEVFDLTERLSASSSGAPAVIILSQNKRPDDLRRAMLAGAAEYLIKPVDVEVLGNAIWDVSEIYAQQMGQAASASEAAVAEEHVEATVITVTGVPRSVGKTTVAVNLSVALAQQCEKKVALIDMQGGETALLMGVRPKRDLCELQTLGEEIDAYVLDNYTAHHESGVSVLVNASTNTFDRPEALDPVVLTRVIGILGQSHAFVVLDSSPATTAEIPLAVLRSSKDIVVLSMAWDLVTLRNTRFFLDALENLQCPLDRIRLILNRSDDRDLIEIPDVEHILQRPVWLRIPNDGPACANAINLGKPLVMQQPANSVATEITDLARRLAGLPVTTKEKKRKFAFF